MPQTLVEPSSPDLDRPTCFSCGQPMVFAAVAIHDDDHDLRTFECSSCRRSETVMVRCG
jgi:hypothetical protein